VENNKAVVAVADAFGEAGTVVEGTHRHAGTEQVDDFHRNINAR
jgi:hypothetical protein